MSCRFGAPGLVWLVLGLSVVSLLAVLASSGPAAARTVAEAPERMDFEVTRVIDILAIGLGAHHHGAEPHLPQDPA